METETKVTSILYKLEEKKTSQLKFHYVHTDNVQTTTEPYLSVIWEDLVAMILLILLKIF